MTLFEFPNLEDHVFIVGKWRDIITKTSLPIEQERLGPAYRLVCLELCASLATIF